VCALALLVLAWTSPSHAQVRTTALGATLGAGLERGGGRDGGIVQRAPIFLDASLRYWTDEDSRVLLGGSVRFEVEGAGEVGVVPRAEAHFKLGKLELRPGVGFAAYLLPYNMFGPEVSLTGRQPLNTGVGLLTMLNVTGFVLGSDVPKDSAVLVIGLSVGLDVEL